MRGLHVSIKGMENGDCGLQEVEINVHTFLYA